MKKKIYIHIGLHKTGSTYIQRFIKLNSQLFMSNNIYIPQNGLIPDKAITNHSNIVWSLTGDTRYSPTNGSFDDLIEEIKVLDCDILISSEDIEYLFSLPEIINHFETTLIANNYKIIYFCYFRNEISHSLSLFNTLKQFDTKINFLNYAFYILKNGLFKTNNWTFYFNIKILQSLFKKNSYFKINIMNFSEHKHNILNSFIGSINPNLLHLQWVFPNEVINARNKKNDNLVKYFFALLIYLKFIIFK